MLLSPTAPMDDSGSSFPVLALHIYRVVCSGTLLHQTFDGSGKCHFGVASLILPLDDVFGTTVVGIIAEPVVDVFDVAVTVAVALAVTAVVVLAVVASVL